MTYRTVSGLAEIRYEVKRSRFIATLMPACDWAEAQQNLKTIRDRFPDATHHCYAFRGTPQNNLSRLGDGGEPSGTAASPIWGVLEKRELYGVILVVTRYFGGIKLGAGGLTGAYAAAAAQVVDAAEVVQMRPAVCYRVTLPYAALPQVQALVQSAEAHVDQTDYDQAITLAVAVPQEAAEGFEGGLKGMHLHPEPTKRHVYRAFGPNRR